MKLLLASVLVLSACGDITVNDPQVTTSVNTQPLKTSTGQGAASTKWTDAQLSELDRDCRETIGKQGIDVDRAANYCACTVTAISERWTWAEMDADPSAVGEAIDKDGTSDRCAYNAGLKRISEEPDQLLVKGMTKAEVIEIVGKPTTIKSTGLNTEFEWTEDPKFARMCANPNGYSIFSITCSLIFDAQGQLIGQRDIKPRWLDIESF